MTNYICTTCGTQYAESDTPPIECAICEDERQFVGWSGQQWTTLSELRQSHQITVRLEELGLYGIGMEPSFAIGQRALLIPHPEGNVLWDCIPLIDDGLVEMVKGIGGISAIAISHPHYYTSMVEWAKAFDCPIYLHADDRQWVMRSDPRVEFWEGETKSLDGGLTLIRCGGHFEGGTVLHWPEGADGRGVILSGDILQVVQDRRWVSFMYSYPNLIPLPASTVQRIVGAVEPFDFERIYGAWWGKVGQGGAGGCEGGSEAVGGTVYQGTGGELMNDRKQKREIEKVIHRVMKTVEKFDHIGKSEFEIILGKIMEQVEKNTNADPEQIVELTPKIIDDMPNEYGQLSEEAKSMEMMIGYLYGKYLKELGLLEA